MAEPGGGGGRRGDRGSLAAPILDLEPGGRIQGSFVETRKIVTHYYFVVNLCLICGSGGTQTAKNTVNPSFPSLNYLLQRTKVI